MLEDKELEWEEKDNDDVAQVHVKTDGDYMDAIEKRADENRQESEEKVDIMKEQDLL